MCSNLNILSFFLTGLSTMIPTANRFFLDEINGVSVKSAFKPLLSLMKEDKQYVKVHAEKLINKIKTNYGNKK